MARGDEQALDRGLVFGEMQPAALEGGVGMELGEVGWGRVRAGGESGVRVVATVRVAVTAAMAAAATGDETGEGLTPGP